jgi:hypothetical protein
MAHPWSLFFGQMVWDIRDILSGSGAKVGSMLRNPLITIYLRNAMNGDYSRAGHTARESPTADSTGSAIALRLVISSICIQ